MAPSLRAFGGPGSLGLALLLAAACWLAGPARAQSGDPARGLKSKVVAERLAAVEALRASSDPGAEKLLQGALADRDWEVVERAAAALAERGTEASSALLVRVAIDGPIARIRRTAARTLAKIAPEKASGELVKLTSGKSARRALEALAVVGPAAPADAADSLAAAYQRGAKAKDAETRLAAARCVAGLAPEAAAAALAELARGKSVEQACGALESAAAAGKPELLAPLLALLREPELADVLERRTIAAAVACFVALERAGAAPAAERLAAFVAQGKAPSAEAEARCARFHGALARAATAGGPLAAAAEGALVAAVAHDDARVRKAALAGLARAGLAKGRESAAALAPRDPDATVRLVALAELARAPGVKEVEVRDLCIDRLADQDARVRELAAVALGEPGLEGATDALARATADPSWAVATCAAVSLGKTRDPAAQPALEGLLAHADWRHRASAVAGLCWLARKEAVPALLRALGDADPSVRRTAFVFLQHQTKAGLAEDRAAWESWWRVNEQRVRLIDPLVAKQRREKYGYALDTATAFQELDVVVLESRGDHIQRLLERLAIAHRMTQASKLTEAALHPGAVYVSNCTGEIETADVERIAWYVRAGGVLFGSCWSLEETIERVHPGILRRTATSGAVLDDVVACPVDVASPYLKGVFAPDMEPLYHLEGSHLIDVLEPELCEVLIDSPQAQERWGSGNLAAAFRSGHGTILDSANHFELQGLEVAPGLKTADDRIAFAFDRMGLDYATWRKTQSEKWWDSALKASQNVFDESALEFVTNFVRAKRLADL